MNDKDSFIQESYKYILIAFLVSIYGIAKESASIMFLTAIFLLFVVLKTSKKNIFYWSFFFIPNIRLLDVTEVTFIVNFLMVTPIVKYIFCYDFLKKRSLGILMGLGLFLFECIHIIYFETFNIFFPTIAWALAFALCIMASTDKNILLNKGDIYDALSVGIIFSSLIYLLAEPKAVFLNFYDFKERFIAYADDPNYFSLYILYCLSTWLMIEKNKCRYITFMGIGFIGFLTSSKMEFLLSSLIFTYIAISFFWKNNIKKVLYKLPILLCIISGFIISKIDVIIKYYENIISRMGGTGASLDTLTTGRFHLQLYYLNDFIESFSSYILGSGFTYFKFLGEPSVRGAHNTFIDILAAWGIVGGVFFIIVLYCWIIKSKTNYLATNQAKYICYLPITIFVMSLCALSCFSANMFPFLILANFPFLKSND